jgi:prevent-host-death family protein
MANLAKLEYPDAMRTVNIGTLKNQLSAHLRYVREGEEVVVMDRNRPVARILPFRAPADLDAEEAYLVATGQIILEKKPMDWEAFWKLPKGNVAHDVAVKAAIEAKGDR